MDYSPPGFPAHGIFQARTLECHFLLQVIFLTPGIKTGSPALQADSSPSQPPGMLVILYSSHCITLNVPVFVSGP